MHHTQPLQEDEDGIAPRNVRDAVVPVEDGLAGREGRAGWRAGLGGGHCQVAGLVG